AAEVKQAGSEVDNITGGSAAEAVIIGVVQLHAGGMVLVKRAASHPGGRNRQAVQGCGLFDCDRFLDQFKKIHLHLAILVPSGTSSDRVGKKRRCTLVWGTPPFASGFGAVSIVPGA